MTTFQAAIDKARSELEPIVAIIREMDDLDYKDARNVVVHFGRAASHLGEAFALDLSLRTDVASRTILFAADVVETLRIEPVESGVHHFVAHWADCLASTGAQNVPEAIGEAVGEAAHVLHRFHPLPSGDWHFRPRSTEGPSGRWIASYCLAAFDWISEQEGANAGIGALSRLRSVLRASQDDIGRMLGVTGETIRRWESGATRIPKEHLATLTAADSALGILLEVFMPTTIPDVIRRPATLFDGERAIDWILRGRIGEVARRYDLLTRYQE